MRSILTGLILLITLLACSQVQARQYQQGQVSLGEQSFRVAVANDHGKRSRGLMFVQNLPEDAGMLFVFPDSQHRLFWMKNTVVELDILYFDENRRLLNIQRAVPCRRDPCPHYPSRGRARYVLEINAGLSERFGFQRGMVLEIDVEQALLEQGYRE